jgi:hypothetical protein
LASPGYRLSLYHSDFQLPNHSSCQFCSTSCDSACRCRGRPDVEWFRCPRLGSSKERVVVITVAVLGREVEGERQKRSFLMGRCAVVVSLCRLDARQSSALVAWFGGTAAPSVTVRRLLVKKRMRGRETRAKKRKNDSPRGIARDRAMMHTKMPRKRKAMDSQGRRRFKLWTTAGGGLGRAQVRVQDLGKGGKAPVCIRKSIARCSCTA